MLLCVEERLPRENVRDSVGVRVVVVGVAEIPDRVVAVALRRAMVLLWLRLMENCDRVAVKLNEVLALMLLLLLLLRFATLASQC